MIRIAPQTFTKVEFTADDIQSVVREVIARIDQIADPDVELVIDEDQPTTRLSIAALDPLVFHLDSGALEDTRKPRHFGVEMASVSIASLFIEYLDRIDPSFGAPPVGQPEDLAQRIAWSAHTHGRVQRLGYRVHQPKHRYNFRNRHGFSDAADRAFDTLWTAEALTWADIIALCPSST